jgi:hypothetical protein
LGAFQIVARKTFLSLAASRFEELDKLGLLDNFMIMAKFWL